MNKKKISYLLIYMFVLIGIVLSFESVRQKLTYYVVRFNKGDTLLYGCHNIKIPKNWIINSKQEKNGTTTYIVRKYIGGSSFLFVGIVSDYDGKLINHPSIKPFSTIEIEDVTHTILELTVLKPNNPTRFVSKVSSEPIIIMGNSESEISEFFKDAENLSKIITNTCINKR